MVKEFEWDPSSIKVGRRRCLWFLFSSSPSSISSTALPRQANLHFKSISYDIPTNPTLQTIKMRSAAIFVPFVASLAAALPQSGGFFSAVGNKYSGGGCTDQSLIFADPVFGDGNVCQPLNRFEGAVPVVSYKLLSASAGCTVRLYSDTTCSGTAYVAPAGTCVQGNSPFLSVFVTCPPPA